MGVLGDHLMFGTSGAVAVGLQRTISAFTDAQVKAWPTTPLQLLAAPGSGYRHTPFLILLLSEFSAGAYANVHADGVVVPGMPSGTDWGSYLANDSGIGLTYLSNFLGAVDSSVVFREWMDIAAGWGALPYPQPTWYGNAALELKFDNQGAGNLTGGNAANSLIVVTWHFVTATP
jgi:hypothetical protein